MVGQDFPEIEKRIGLFLCSGKITLEFNRHSLNVSMLETSVLIPCLNHETEIITSTQVPWTPRP